MVKPSINDILEKINNRYYLVGTVAKRAREIVDGSEIYVENKKGENKPVCLATEEVAEGKITYRLLTPEEIEQKEFKKKVAIIVIIFIICILFERGYMKDTQQGIMRIYNSKIK